MATRLCSQSNRRWVWGNLVDYGRYRCGRLGTELEWWPWYALIYDYCSLSLSLLALGDGHNSFVAVEVFTATFPWCRDIIKKCLNDGVHNYAANEHQQRKTEVGIHNTVGYSMVEEQSRTVETLLFREFSLCGDILSDSVIFSRLQEIQHDIITIWSYSFDACFICFCNLSKFVSKTWVSKSPIDIPVSHGVRQMPLSRVWFYASRMELKQQRTSWSWRLVSE